MKYKYKDLNIEIEKMLSICGMVIPIEVGALGVVTKTLPDYCVLVSQNLDVFNLQKLSLLRTSRIIWKVLQL